MLAFLTSSNFSNIFYFVNEKFSLSNELIEKYNNDNLHYIK